MPTPPPDMTGLPKNASTAGYLSKDTGKVYALYHETVAFRWTHKNTAAERRGCPTCAAKAARKRGAK